MVANDDNSKRKIRNFMLTVAFLLAFLVVYALLKDESNILGTVSSDSPLDSLNTNEKETTERVDDHQAIGKDISQYSSTDSVQRGVVPLNPMVPIDFSVPYTKSSKTGVLYLLHITKTGGTTLETLAHRAGVADWGIRNNKIFNWKHLKCAMQRTWHSPMWIFDKGNPYDGHPVFVVVRNPFTRFISEYNFHGDGYQGPHPELPANLNKWVQRKIRYMQRDRKPAWCYGLHRGGHFIPQYHYVYDPRTGERLVEHVVRFENLVEDFNALMDTYGYPVHIDPHHNKKYQKPMGGDRKLLKPKDYDATTVAMICDFYGKDFELFGYDTSMCP